MREVYKKFRARVRQAHATCLEKRDESEFTSEAINKIAKRMNLTIDTSKLLITSTDKYWFKNQICTKPGRILYLKSRKAIGL